MLLPEIKTDKIEPVTRLRNVDMTDDDFETISKEAKRAGYGSFRSYTRIVLQNLADEIREKRNKNK